MREGQENTGGESGCFWKQSQGILKGSIDPQIFEAYIQPLKIIGYQNNEIRLSAPSRLVCQHVDKHFREKILSTIQSITGEGSLVLKILLSETRPAQERKTVPYAVARKSFHAAPQRDNQHKGPSSTGRSGTINSRYTFENFVVGNSNQFCHAAAMRVAEEPGESYNPFFIYGGVGLGKTHLLHAIGNAVLTKNPSARVVYLSSESFTNQLINNLRKGTMDNFKKKMRSIEVLLVDDIQFICGKERTQEEFFHTFNALHNSRHQIVMTSDKLPQEIPGIEERLKTRFSWGLTADLQTPDLETRIAIVKRKASLISLVLSRDTTQYIAEQFSSNIRELEGAITRLAAASSLSNQKVSLELAESALKPLIQAKIIQLSIEDIKKSVANHFGLKVSDLNSKRRTRNICFPRHIAMYLSRKHTTSSYPEIGGSFGGRDHSSVIHAANVVQEKLTTDEVTKKYIHEIESLLFGKL